MKYNVLKGYIAHSLKIISKYEINKYDKFNNIVNEKEKIRKKYANNSNKKWRIELHDLKISNTSFKRQLELAQMIMQKLKFIEASFEKCLYLPDKRVRFSHQDICYQSSCSNNENHEIIDKGCINRKYIYKQSKRIIFL